MRRNVFVRNVARLAWAGAAAAALLSGPARAEDVVISEEARTHFSAGVALLQDPQAPRYEEAYREFKAAYAASPSYKILGNLGLCAMKIERDGEAIDAFEKYLLEARDASPEQMEQIKRDLLTLRTGVVEVRVSSTPAGAAIHDVRQPVTGSEVRNSYAPSPDGTPMVLKLRRGHHVITATLPGYEDARWEFEASGTTLPPHVFELSRPKTAADESQPVMVQERPIPTSAYVSGAVTAGLVVGGVVFGLVSLQRHSDYDTLNDGTHVSAANDARSHGQALNLITDLFFGGAVVGAGVTTYLLLTRPTVEKRVGVSGFRVAPTWDMKGRGGGAAAAWDF